MYYFEKDYIMRLIHGIARMLARMIFGEEAEDSGPETVLESACRADYDILRELVDEGRINAAENRLFELLETTAWEDRQKVALVLGFYDYVNSKDDEFLAASDFSREEVIEGLEEAMKAVHMEIPEYLRIG